MAGLNFGNVIDTDKKLIPTGYRSPDSGQTETEGTLSHTAADAYETLYTVTTGKSFFATSIICSNVDGNPEVLNFARGAPAGEVDFLSFNIEDNATLQFTFPTPIKFTSATRISVGCNPVGADNIKINILGFEE